MRFDINETLLRHLATGGGAAYMLRRRATHVSMPGARPFTEVVADFFSARSDVRRLHRAQEVANMILRVNDFGDIMELRNIVAEQELSRLIQYAKQKDHTSHTVYLYLL